MAILLYISPWGQNLSLSKVFSVFILAGNYCRATSFSLCTISLIFNRGVCISNERPNCFIHSDSQYKGGWMLLPSWHLAQRYLHVSWSWGLAGSCAKRGELRWSDIFVVSFFTTLHGWHSRHWQWSSPLYSCVATRGIGEVWSQCDGDTA